MRIIIHGYNGKMGKVVNEIVESDNDLEVVSGIDTYITGQENVPMFKSLNDCNIDADVVIDFSNSSSTDALLDACIDKKLPLVLCTTGLGEQQLDKVDRASKKIAVLRSANMSLGVNLVQNLAKIAALVLFDAGFDIELIEKHHNMKVDAPSGTALAIADSVNEALGNKLNYIYDRSKTRDKRNRNELGISAIRGGSIVGEHELIFAGQDEVVSIKHEAFSRNVFAKGAVSAAKFLAGKKSGLYTMQDVISQD